MRVGFIKSGDAYASVVEAMRTRPGVEVVELCGGASLGDFDALVLTDGVPPPAAGAIPTIGLNCELPGLDHQLVVSKAARDRLVASGFDAGCISVGGDPRLDPAQGVAGHAVAASDKQTVLYSPIASPRRSSGYVYGAAVLEHFLRDDRCNLIFAPDPRLFARRLHFDGLRFGRPGAIGRHIYDAPNIHIDLTSGGTAWAAGADLCLGDPGRTIDAFLRTPRPCLFLGRRHGAAAHWLAGEVVADASSLNDALDRAVATHQRYRSFQEVLFARRTDVGAEPAAERAARAILSVIAPSRPISLADRRGGVRQDGSAA